MSIKMAENEQIIKEYAYATTREGGFFNKRITKNSLIVTNKRIIKKDECEKSGYQKNSISEISVGSISGMNTKTSSSYKFVFVVLGVLFAISAIVCIAGLSKDSSMIIPMLISGALSALFIYLFIKNRFNALTCTFIVLDRVNTAMSINGYSFNSLTSRFSVSSKSSFVKIVVDANVCNDFVNEIGALVIDIQNGIYDNISENS
ncbi:MAG: hypothetical protein E7677_01425 [Ruminococcaceae bacterium]|nr:hypothetical protein [Oscillospiraceae bacterium]